MSTGSWVGSALGTPWTTTDDRSELTGVWAHRRCGAQIIVAPSWGGSGGQRGPHPERHWAAR
jgi:hypothetical protein